MKILAGTHGTGKTGSLLLTAAADKDAIVFCRDVNHARLIKHDLNIHNITLLSYEDFLDYDTDGRPIYVDDICDFMKTIMPTIEGFTVNID